LAQAILAEVVIQSRRRVAVAFRLPNLPTPRLLQ